MIFGGFYINISTFSFVYGFLFHDFIFKVIFLDDMLNTQVKNKRNCLNIVTALHVLLHNLLSSGMDSSGLRPNSDLSLKEGESCQVAPPLD